MALKREMTLRELMMCLPRATNHHTHTSYNCATPSLNVDTPVPCALIKFGYLASRLQLFVHQPKHSYTFARVDVCILTMKIKTQTCDHGMVCGGDLALEE